MKVKTFKFKVFSKCVDNDLYMKKQNAHDEYETLRSPEQIDKEVNEFCKDKDVIDIKVNTVYQTITEENGTNTAVLFYTVIYKNENEQKQKMLND